MVVARFEEGNQVEENLSALPGYKMKNMTMVGNTTELVAEVRLDSKAMDRLSQLRNAPGVKEISIMNSVSGSVL
jgi:hypothetical protein